MNKKISQFMTLGLIIFVIIILMAIFITSIPLNPVTTTTTTVRETTTTIIDCGTMNPNYCNIDEDCVCSMDKCFRGNKDYSEKCVQKTEACSMNFCFFAPGENMICVDHNCKVGKKFDTLKSCTSDGECVIINSLNRCPYCDRDDICGDIDYSQGKYIAVNSDLFSNWQIENCPLKEECLEKYGPLPLCTTRLMNDNFEARCIDNICKKVAK